MVRTTYDTRGSSAAEKLIEDLFAIGRVGYVAVCSGDQILLREAPGLVAEPTAESNFYEELLVNPTLLKLASQRGALDCGGLDHIAVGYGDFTQLIMLTRDGHVSLGLSKKAPVRDVAEKVLRVLEEHGLEERKPKAWLLAQGAPAY